MIDQLRKKLRIGRKFLDFSRVSRVVLTKQHHRNEERKRSNHHDSL
jgi:hypothetical protein